MDYFSAAAILVVLSAVFGYINVRFLKLPITIGLMIILTNNRIIISKAGEIPKGNTHPV